MGSAKRVWGGTCPHHTAGLEETWQPTCKLACQWNATETARPGQSACTLQLSHVDHTEQVIVFIAPSASLLQEFYQVHGLSYLVLLVHFFENRVLRFDSSSSCDNSPASLKRKYMTLMSIARDRFSCSSMTKKTGNLFLLTQAFVLREPRQLFSNARAPSIHSSQPRWYVSSLLSPMYTEWLCLSLMKMLSVVACWKLFLLLWGNDSASYI